MKQLLLSGLALLMASQVQAQFPSNSFAVRSACPGSAGNPSTLESINTDGSMTLIGTVRKGTAPLVLNALGRDQQDSGNLYGMNVTIPSLADLAPIPHLYSVSLATAQASDLGQVTPPPESPGASLLDYKYRQTLNFIGDGDNTSSYFVGGVSFNYSIFTNTITNFRFYVGQVQLSPFTTAAPTWRVLDVSDPATTALITNYASQIQAFISGGASGPAPEGGIQDWIFDSNSGNLVSYAGQENKFITISNISTLPTAVTTTPTTPLPANQDMGAMFSDHQGGVYAVAANNGTIYKINRLTGDWTGQTYGSALGCNRGDAVSFADALPLPVTLTRFEAATTGPTVRLSWATAFEQQADYFEVERSATATTASWSTVARVVAGNQTTGQQYAATDPTPLPGTAYYRLAMHDRDGSVTYSNVRVIRGAAIVAVYPNPVRSVAQVLLPVPGEAATLELVSARGQVVRQLAVPAGSASVELPMADLPAGFYLLRVQQAGATATNRVMLEK